MDFQLDVSRKREAATNREHAYQRDDTVGGELEIRNQRTSVTIFPNLVINPVVILYRMRVEMRDSDLDELVS